MLKFLKDTGESAWLVMVDHAVAAGFPSPAMDYKEERIDLAKQLAPRPLSTFYCYCDGDSMLDACIPPGAILVVDKSLTAKTGNIVVAFLNGGFTVKYIKIENDKVFLIPANKQQNYQPVEVTEEMGLIVWGVVTNIVIDTKKIKLCMRS